MLVVFIAYYSPEQYQILLNLADDRKKLDDKWHDWLSGYLKLKTHLQGDVIVEDIHIDVQKMHDYFKANKLKNTSRNRAEYVTSEGKKSYEKRPDNQK